MKKYLCTLFLVIFLLIPLFSQLFYPEIPYSELEDYNYQIIYENTYDDYYIVKIEGVFYIVYYWIKEKSNITITKYD